jgi:hypothetical protein
VWEKYEKMTIIIKEYWISSLKCGKVATLAIMRHAACSSEGNWIDKEQAISRPVYRSLVKRSLTVLSLALIMPGSYRLYPLFFSLPRSRSHLKGYQPFPLKTSSI